MTAFTTEDRINAEIEPIPFFGVVVINSEKIRVYRFKSWDAEDDNHFQLSEFYATRQFIEQLHHVSIIEHDFIVVDSLLLDHLGRYFIETP